MMWTKGGYAERIDREGYPIQYAVEGRLVLNRAESLILHVALKVREWWFEYLYYPVAYRVAHLFGRHHFIACRGRRGCA